MADSNNKKTMAVLCYIWFLWIVPLLTDSKDDPFVKFHINQGIILTLGSVVIGVIGWIPVIGGIVSWVGGIAIFILAIIGIINAVNMEQKPLPLIGTLLTIYK